MSPPFLWSRDDVEYLFVLCEVLKYSYTLCAQLMERERRQPFTKNAMIGLYNREKAKGFKLSPEVIAEVKEAAGLT